MDKFKHMAVRLYTLSNGKIPFLEWLDKIEDPTIWSRVLRRIDRLSLGHEGDAKFLGDGVYELRLHFGSGYRIYYVKSRVAIVVLLLGGDKHTQAKDIKLAKAYWRELRERTSD